MNPTGMARWPVWKQSAFLNIGAIIFTIFLLWVDGSGFRPSIETPATIASLVLVNFLVFVAGPRMRLARTQGQAMSFWSTAVQVLRERPVIAALFVLLMLAVSRLITVELLILQGLLLAHQGEIPAVAYSASWTAVVFGTLTGIAALWLASAIGLWMRRAWAWWLGFGLNGLVVVGTIGVSTFIAARGLHATLLVDWPFILSATTLALLIWVRVAPSLAAQAGLK